MLVITLTGPGGSGKTRLALELARTMKADGATRVVFVPLAAIRNPAFVASAIVRAPLNVARPLVTVNRTMAPATG